jgi:hypothetical protein
MERLERGLHEYKLTAINISYLKIAHACQVEVTSLLLQKNSCKKYKIKKMILISVSTN